MSRWLPGVDTLNLPRPQLAQMRNAGTLATHRPDVDPWTFLTCGLPCTHSVNHKCIRKCEQHLSRLPQFFLAHFFTPCLKLLTFPWPMKQINHRFIDLNTSHWHGYNLLQAMPKTPPVNNVYFRLLRLYLVSTATLCAT